MKLKYIKQLEGCSLGFYVNLDANGIDNEDGYLSADDFDQVGYYIKDGKLFLWSGEELLDLSDIEDWWWEDAMQPEFDDVEPRTWFECFIDELMNVVLCNELPGADEFRNLIDDERILIVLLKDADFNIVEEIDEWDIKNFVD